MSVSWIPKNWGGEKVIVNNDKYCGKILYYLKNKKSSIHFHKLKKETFYVLRGSIQLCVWENFNDFCINDKKVGRKILVLEEGDVFDLLPNTIHQVSSLKDSEIIEFSTTHFDDDSYRIEKGD